MIRCSYQPETDELLLFAGSHEGDVVVFQAVPGDLIHKASLVGGHTDVVRTIQYFPDDGVILSGAEDGRVCQWKTQKPVEPEPTPTEETMNDEDGENIDFLTGDTLRRKDIRKRYRYVINPYYLKPKKH